MTPEDTDDIKYMIDCYDDHIKDCLDRYQKETRDIYRHKIIDEMNVSMRYRDNIKLIYSKYI